MDRRRTMPLEIAYRPIDLPLPAPRRAAAPIAPVAAASEFDRLKTQVLADRAAPARPDRFVRLRSLAATFGWRHRAAGIAAIGALGVTLGAIGWGGTIAPARAQIDARQPFERAGESFPGSAFYYLDSRDSGLVSARAAQQAWARQGDAPAQLATNPLAQGFSAAGIANPIARPLFAVGSGGDHYRAVQCLTAAIYYEAASEPDAGQRAVAQVVLNRMAHPAFPKTVCGVVYQGSEHPGCQFSFACDGSMARRPMAQFWDRARRVANDALAGNVFAPVGLATHYHTGAVHPAWDDEMQLVDVIGAHRFYRWPGLAGRPSAFSATYHGGEPLAAPHPRVVGPAPANDIASDPIALARAFEQGRLTAMKSAAATETPFAQGQAGKRGPSPLYAPELEKRGGDALYRAGNLPGDAASTPDADTALPEYRNSGRWIAQPGG